MKSVLFSAASLAALLVFQDSAHAFSRKRPLPVPRPTVTSTPAPAPTPTQAPAPVPTRTPVPVPTETPPPEVRAYDFVIEVFEGPVANNKRVVGASVRLSTDSRTTDGNGFTHFFISEGEHTIRVTANGLNDFEARYKIDRAHTGSGSYKVELVRPVDPSRACYDGVDNDSNSGLPRGIPAAQAQEVIARINRENPDLIRQSCVQTGGNHEFLYKVASELHKLDPRWGLNWKRGNIGDMSHDVINYYRGAGPFSNAPDTYVIDIIGGHCGNNPQPAFIDVTCYGNDGMPSSAPCNPTGARWTMEPMPRC